MFLTIKNGGTIPNDLQILELQAISYSECRSKLSLVGVVTESHICTLTKEGEGACHVIENFSTLMINSMVSKNFLMEK